VKYFNNEEFEARRYDEQLQKWTKAQVTNQYSLSALNVGQAAIIAVAVTAMMWQAADRVASGEMTIGDIVLVNAFMIQLYIPLNFLGVLYREIRQSLTDIERMFGLMHTHREIADAPDARTLPTGPASVRFENVSFAYDAKRPILFDVDFDIPAGSTVAVVGHSGSGKSTLARLLYRFYDVQGGALRINGQDLRSLTQDSLRAAIGIVPQDTVLFNDTLYYNIHYGRPGASREEVEAAARAAQLEDFIRQLPEGYETRVGERGLKLSGGEKQRVAIARALLKNPAILIFDEATSALDSRTEKAIQAQIELAAEGRTALVIAHRLSTIMNADEIIVLDKGRIVERGRHAPLLAQGGAYAQMWLLQQQEAFEQRGRVALEDVLVADVEQLAHDLEARVDHDRGAAVGEDHAAVVLQQHGVELHHHLGGDVVALHQHLGGAPGGRGLDAEDAGELFLVVEEQAVLRAPGEMMQADADVLQEALDRAQFAGFAAGDEAVAGEVAPAVAKPGRACDPAQHLQVAQPAGALLAVGLEGVGRVVEAGVALFLLEQLGLVEGAHVERFAVARAQLGKQRRVAGEQTRLEQVGLHGDVVGGGDHAFVDRAHRMTDLEPAVPQRADQRRQARLQRLVGRCG